MKLKTSILEDIGYIRAKFQLERFKVIIMSLLSLCFICNISNAKNIKSANQTSTLSFTGVSDVHFDPFMGCHFIKRCQMVAKLAIKPISKWDKILINNKEQRRQRLLISMDPNLYLLNKTLLNLKQQILKSSASFVVITGDLVGHNLKKNYQRYFGSNKGYKKFVHKLYQYLHFKLQTATQNTPLYFVMGNNDGYLGDYVINAGKQFFKDLANDWPTLNNNHKSSEMTRLLSQSGTYSIISKNNWRLIILNSNLFYKKIHGDNQEKYAHQALQWLTKQLNTAQLKQQKVLIFYHIPFGIFPTKRFSHASKSSLWLPIVNNTYIKLYNKYRKTIKAMIHSHVHRDLFMKAHKDHKNIMPQYLISAVSPIFGNRPSFSLFKYKKNQLSCEQFYF